MASPLNPNQNQLLAALSPAEAARLTPCLELVPMPLGEVYYDSGGRLPYIYFPTSSVVSLHSIMKNGASAEIAGVGNEGLLGVSLFMDGNSTPSRASVCIAGYGYKVKTHLLMEEFNRGGPLQRLLLRYAQALNTQAAQTSSCNWHHTTEQQLCRWLLLTLNRSQSKEPIVTLELLANQLGVHRETMAEAVKKLQQAGLIRNHRSHITVLDLAGLENRACECYDVIKKSFSPVTRTVEHKVSRAGVLHRLYSRRVECIPSAQQDAHQLRLARERC